MAYYLCRLRLDRVAVDEEKSKGEEIILKEDSIETKRYYLRLTDEFVEETDKSKYVLRNDFLEYIFDSNDDPMAARVQEVVDTLNAAELLENNVSEFDLTVAPLCPICEKVQVTNKTDLINGETIVDINEHIKKCSNCNKYYCDGTGERRQGEIEGENISYNVQHKLHYDDTGHWPDGEPNETHNLVSMEDLRGKSLIDKFKVYCLSLDSKDINIETDKLDSYLKQNLSSNTYMVYKYVTEDGSYILRLKVEITPTDYFLSRDDEFRSLGLLEKKINAFYAYNNEPIYSDLTVGCKGSLISKVDSDTFTLFEQDSGNLVIGIDSETESDFDVTWERMDNVSYNSSHKNEVDAGVEAKFTFSKEDFTETFEVPVYATEAGKGYVKFSFKGMERIVEINVKDRIFSDIKLGSSLFTLSKTTPVILTINLAKQITHNQTVSLILPDVEGANFTPAGATTITFTPSNWSTVQRIQLTTSGLAKGTYELILRSIDNHGNNIDATVTVIYE